MTTSQDLRIIATIGLPASGKTSWAYAQQCADPSIVLVSKDEIRAMIYGNGNVPWSPKHERLTEAIRDDIVEEALSFGYSVIVHDTNLAKVHLKALSDQASWYDAEFITHSFLDVDVDECVRRDALRGDKSVGERVIRNMRDIYKELWETCLAV